MKYRTIGQSQIKISEVGIGTWEMSGDVWGKKSDSESIQAIERGFACGANFIDTAAGYGSGHVESLVGRFLSTSGIARESIVISTKVRPKCGKFAPPPEDQILDFYPSAYIIEQCEASLKRLNTEYIDILFLHTWSRSWGAETEWQDAIAKLKAAGKIRLAGISVPDEGADDANVQVALRSIDVVQCVYSVFQQEPEYTLFPLAVANGVGVIARSPFSSGAIVQEWSDRMSFPDGDWRGSWPLSVKPGWLQDQVSMSQIAKEILSKSGISLAPAALKYVLGHIAVSSVIPGSANPKHVEQNMMASDAKNLPDDVVAEIKAQWRTRRLHGTYNGSI